MKKPARENAALSVFLILISFLAFLNIYFYLARNSKAKILGRQENLEEQKKYWEEILKESPTYLDAWIELSLTAQKMGDNNLALGALKSAQGINPGSQKVISLQEFLETH